VVAEANGAPVLVAYNFKHDLARLCAYFPKARVLDNDPQTIKDWNAGKIQMLLAHPASAGHGLNLADGGNILAFFGVNWNLEEHAQIIERIGPMRQKQAGYDRPVFIYPILASGTVDEVVMERLSSKRSVQDVLIDAMKRRRA
jgi:SNF2 family DNA or RNA helicase